MKIKRFLDYINENQDKHKNQKKLDLFSIITEEKITHLTHLEDLVLFEGKKGANKILNILKNVYNDIKKHKTTKAQIKVDGSVSIIVGTNPENNKKFIATKSLFNKTPKINYTEEDIERNHGHAPGLVKVLKIGLKYLPDTVKKGILQGDLMYIKEQLKITKMENQKGVLFTPNTITYFVPETTPLYKKIINSKIGVVWHTFYTGDTIESLSASFNVNNNMIKSTKDAYVKTPLVKLDQLGWSKEEDKIIQNNLKILEEDIQKINWSYVKEIIQSDYSKYIPIYMNQKVKDNKKSVKNEIKEFIDYIILKYEKDIEKLKTPKGKAKKREQLKSLINKMSKNAGTLYRLFQFMYSVEAVKDIFVSKMNQIKFGVITYQKTENGYVPTDYEGWVISDGENNVKFVNRAVFSKANFFNTRLKGKQ